MNFCILQGVKPHTAKKTQYVQIETINPLSISNFRNSVKKSEIITKLDTSPMANPNENYNVLSSILSQSKRTNIPKRMKKFNKGKHKKEKWMTDKL